jgi:cystine transport system substrate-binding protein
MAKPPFKLTRRHWLQGVVLAPIASALPALAQTPAGAPCRIGFIRHYEPFSFLDENDRPIGFDVDVSRRLCQLLGRPMQAVPAGLVTLTQGLHTQDIDWLGNQLLITPDNRRHYDFVQPAYANIQLSCVQHEDDQRDFLSLDDLVGKRLGVLAGTGVEEQARAALGKSVVAFEHIEQGLHALAKQQIDAVLEENLIAEYYIEQHHWPIKVTAPFAAPIALGLPVRKGDEATRQQLAQAIQTLLRDGSLKTISERWFGYDVSRPRASPARAA